MPEIHQWRDIEAGFNHGLLLGNGASVAVDAGFSYGSLFEEAARLGHLTPPVRDVFNRFDANDFEFVLRRLWQAKIVNEALGIEPGRVEEAYQEVRTALISTIRDVHVSYEEATPHLNLIYQFMQRFETVVCLNYDLIVYWAALHGNNSLGQWFKDCFVKGTFREDWDTVRAPYGRAQGSTLFFYPHGNLVLARRKTSLEGKISVQRTYNLLEEIFDSWESGALVPIFVCEGTSAHKLNSIRDSSYLQRVYREVMPAVGESLVVYGWSMSAQDNHIVECLKKGNIRRVAFSVFSDDQELAEEIEGRLTAAGVREVLFFDSSSEGCWNNPIVEG